MTLDVGKHMTEVMVQEAYDKWVSGRDEGYPPWADLDENDRYLAVGFARALVASLPAIAVAQRPSTGMSDEAYRGNLRYAFARGAMATGAWSQEESLAAAYLAWPETPEAGR